MDHKYLLWTAITLKPSAEKAIFVFCSHTYIPEDKGERQMVSIKERLKNAHDFVKDINKV